MRQLPLIEDASNELTGSFRLLVDRLMDQLKELDRQVAEPESQIKAWHRTSDASCKLEKIRGIGPITASVWSPPLAMRRTSTAADRPKFGRSRQAVFRSCDWRSGTSPPDPATFVQMPATALLHPGVLLPTVAPSLALPAPGHPLVTAADQPQ
jgi:hypothetical protein